MFENFSSTNQDVGVKRKQDNVRNSDGPYYIYFKRKLFVET